MASIFERYGIKEVADFTFYEIEADGSPGAPVLILDTLKVSTIEVTAENVSARGGKGNPALVSWDFGKDITVAIEDALFSAKSWAIMFGNGSVKDVTGSAVVLKSIAFVGKTVPTTWVSPDGTEQTIATPAYYTAAGEATDAAAIAAGADTEEYFVRFPLNVNGVSIEIEANTFPGTYFATGDTFARSEITGKDEFVQIQIPKVKMQVENTITLEAEGDPSVFNMNLQVMRPAGGKPMMSLIKYDLV